MATIAELRISLMAELDDLALTYGEETALDQTGKDAVSSGVDSIHETWNDQLPPRP